MSNSNQTLEQFVNSIRNLYSASTSTATTSAGSNQQQQQQQSSDSSPQTTGTKSLSVANYGEILNVINSNLEALTDNAANLMDNVLPVFPLPDYTLPNMAVLYAIIMQLQQQSAAATSQQQQQTLNINQEKLVNEIENCIRLADESQVRTVNLFIKHCFFFNH